MLITTKDQAGVIHLFTLLVVVLLLVTVFTVNSWFQRQNRLEQEIQALSEKQQILETEVKLLESRQALQK